MAAYLLEKESQAGAKLEPAYLQNLASDPESSVYVSASAGTGKTKVLVDRILRLLLRGTPPENILCITFTNAAADEMFSRLKAKLYTWLISTYSELQIDLYSLTGTLPSDTLINRAKNLYQIFLSNLENIKIQTIHSFCTNVLNLASNISNLNLIDIKIIDDFNKNKILQHSIDDVLAQSNQNNQLAKCTKHLASLFDYSTLLELSADLLSQKIRLTKYIEQHSDIEQLIQNIYINLGATYNLSIQAIISEAISDLSLQNIIYATSILVEEKEKLGINLLGWLNADSNTKQKNFAQYCQYFLTKENQKRLKITTAKFAKKYQAIQDIIETEQERMLDIVDKISSQKSAESNASLITFMHAVLLQYENIKNQMGYIEYDDLLLMTIKLLSDSEHSGYLLYTLDISIDHILVDEAQDLSPLQWQLIQLLTEEFFSGSSAKDYDRTIFIVGDFKQSIFSFQGAEPEIFKNIRLYYRSKVKAVQQKWLEVELNHSFRSAPEILQAVDQVFSHPTYKAGLGLDYELKHLPFRQAKGFVKILPLLTKNDTSTEQENKFLPIYPDTSWIIPELAINKKNLKWQIASAIVNQISGWLQSSKELSGHKRPIKAKDILILLRKRSILQDYLVAGLKNLNISVERAHTNNLLQHLIIQDLLGIIKFILLPNDSLNLAALLKSPIMNFSEDQLFISAYNRENKSTLWQRIQQLYPTEATYLDSILQLAQENSIYDLFCNVLNTKRHFFIKRFGYQAVDVINAFMQKILEFEQNNITTSPEAFLSWIEHTDWKNVSGHKSDENSVRIMTVHTAKGQQSPIVILADAADSENTPADNIIWYKNQLFFSTGKAYDNEVIKKIKKYNRKQKEQENLRLLYVAMTRAEDELYIYGWKSKQFSNSWYDILENYCISSIQEKAADTASVINSDIIAAENNQILHNKFEQIPDYIKYKTPFTNHTDIDVIQEHSSDLQQTKQQDTNNRGIIKGTIIHQLLYELPKIAAHNRPKYINNFVCNHSQYTLLTEEDRKEIQDIALNTLKNFPNLFFNSRNFSEISITGVFEKNTITIQIDKLIIHDSLIEIIEFKSDHLLVLNEKSVPKNYVNQLFRYKCIIESIYKSHTVKCKILWLYAQHIMDINFLSNNYKIMLS